MAQSNFPAWDLDFLVISALILETLIGTCWHFVITRRRGSTWRRSWRWCGRDSWGSSCYFWGRRASKNPTRIHNLHAQGNKLYIQHTITIIIFFKVEPMFFSLFCTVFCTCLHSRYVRSTEQIGCRDVRTICLHARDNILLVIVNSDVKSFYKTTLLRPCPTWSLMARFSFMSFCHIFSQLWTTKWQRKTLLSPIFHFLESFWAILSHFVTHDLHKREARTGQGTKRRVPLRHLAQGWRSSPSGHGGE